MMTNVKRKKNTSSPTHHDLTAVTKLQRVNAPKQARTEKRLREILQALENLLDGCAFDEITLPDIAKQAKCGIASIYARFKDKRSILVALHESIQERQIEEINESITLERHENLSFDESTFLICQHLNTYYLENGNRLRPAYLPGDREIYDRLSTAMHHASIRINSILLPKVMGSNLTKRILEKRLDMAISSVFALLQQRMVFDQPLLEKRFPVQNTAKELAMLIKTCVST